MKSLTARLTLWYAFIVTLTVVALLVAGRFYLERSLIEGADLLNEVEFEEISSRLSDANGVGVEERLVASIRGHAELDAELYFFQINRANGELLYKSNNLGPHQLPEAVYGQAATTVKDKELGWIRSMEFQYAGLNIYIVSPLNSAIALFDHYERAGFIVCFIVFALSLGIGYFFCRLAIRPIVSIQKTAQRVSASSFNERIPVPNTGDEVAQMAVLLNAMLDRLENSYQQVKRFTAEASHEFRTPLSIIRLHTEHLLTSPNLPVAERAAALAEQMEEVERLNSMIDDLLLLAKADSGVMPLDLRRINLAEYLADVAGDLSLLAAERGVTFSLRDETQGDWCFDSRWMRQVLLNLAANALAVSSSGMVVELHAAIVEGQLCLRVRDEGPGVAEADLGRMFNRFERLGQNCGSAGSGLGLAICSSIVKRHGGSIRALNRSDRTGLIVELRLPRTEPPVLAG